MIFSVPICQLYRQHSIQIHWFFSSRSFVVVCRMWWTITGNFGNILPIDWSKSYARQMHMPALQLNQPTAHTPDDELNDLSSEDEAVANDLDMHALILGSLHTDDEPIKSAEEVLKEIDDIMDETSSDDDEPAGENTEAIEKAKEVLGTPLYAESEFCRFWTFCQLLITPFIRDKKKTPFVVSYTQQYNNDNFHKNLLNNWQTFASIFPSAQNYGKCHSHSSTSCTWKWKYWSANYPKRWSLSWHCATSWNTKRKWKIRLFHYCWVCRINGANFTLKRNGPKHRAKQHSRTVCNLHIFPHLFS